MSGLEGYPGLIGNIARGGAIKVEISIKNDGSSVNVVGGTLFIAFSTNQAGGGDSDVESSIAGSDSVAGLISGEISDTDTLAIAASTKVYYSMRFITATGETYIIDVGVIRVFTTTSSRIEL